MSVTDAEANILARKQSKFKLIALCKENGDYYKYHAPFSSQAEVKKCYDRIKKMSKILCREVKLKKVMFSEMPSDFVYI